MNTTSSAVLWFMKIQENEKIVQQISFQFFYELISKDLVEIEFPNPPKL